MSIRFISILALGLLSASEAIAQVPKVECFGGGNRIEEKVATTTGTVVGLVAGAVASDGNVVVTLTTGSIGCDVGQLFGKAWGQTHDNSAVVANGMSYVIQKTTPAQAIVRFVGAAPDNNQKPGDVVLSLDPGMNAIVIPLTDAALQKLGVSQADRHNIEVLTTPLDPGNFNQKKETINKIFGTRF